LRPIIQLQERTAGKDTAMRIDLWNSPISETAGSDRPARSGAIAKASGSASIDTKEDEARLSFDHGRVRALAEEVHKMPEVREERIAVLRQAIADGTYHKDAQQVASAMLGEVAARSSLVR